MQLQDHVHAIAVDMWPRCSEVVVSEGQIGCKLAKGRAYDLVKAYAKAPHIAFMNCETESDFRRFVSAWGPLLLSPADLTRGWATVDLREYRASRDLLRAVTGTMQACKGLRDERKSVEEMLAALVNMAAPGDAREDLRNFVYVEEIAGPLSKVPQQQDPLEWVRSASVTEIRTVLISCVEGWFGAPNRWKLRVQPRGSGLEIRPSFELHSLWDALRWMLFFDEWNKRPPILCRECPNIFRPSTAHQRKFCSPECAHRAANRVWRHKDLLKQKVKTKRSRESDGTDKTR